MKKLDFLDIVGKIDEKYVTEAKLDREKGVAAVKARKSFNVFKGVISAAVTVFIIGIAFVWCWLEKIFLRLKNPVKR